MWCFLQVLIIWLFLTVFQYVQESGSLGKRSQWHIQRKTINGFLCPSKCCLSGWGLGRCGLGRPDRVVGNMGAAYLLHFLGWSLSHDLHCSERTGQQFRTSAAASLLVFLNSSWDRANSGLRRLSLALVAFLLQAVLAARGWESEALLAHGNVLLGRHAVRIRICLLCLLVLGSSAPQFCSLVFHPPLQKTLGFLGDVSNQTPAETRHAVLAWIQSA